MHRVARIITALISCSAFSVAHADYELIGQFNVLDTNNNIEWRTNQHSLNLGRDVGYGVSGLIPAYGPDATYRRPTAAEVSDLIATSFPGFAGNESGGLCSRDNTTLTGFPDQDELVDAFMRKFYGESVTYSSSFYFESLYEDAGGILRNLYVYMYRSSSGEITNSRVCPTGPLDNNNYYEVYRNGSSNGPTPKPAFVVRDPVDRKAFTVTLFSYFDPYDVGIRPRALVNGTQDWPDVPDGADDTGWVEQVALDFSCMYWQGYPCEYPTTFDLAVDPSSWRDGKVAPWVKAKQLDYKPHSGTCDAGDTDLGDGWCQHVIPGAYFVFTGDAVYSPGSLPGTAGFRGEVDNVVIDQIWENMSMDFQPASPDNTIRPKNPGWTIYAAILTGSKSQGDAHTLNAADVNPESVKLGPDAGAPFAWGLQDVDGDGDLDLNMSFLTGDTGVDCLDDFIVLAAQKYGGARLAARDVINPINCEEPLPIDFDPFNAANTIRPNDNYNATVAVFGQRTSAGDAANIYIGTTYIEGQPNWPNQLEPENLRFGPAETPVVGDPIITDVDGDGIDDMLANFNVFDAGIACGDTEIVMSGEINSTLPIEGIDTILTEDCETSSCHP